MNGVELLVRLSKTKVTDDRLFRPRNQQNDDERGRKWWETGEDRTLRSLINCTFHHALLGW